MTEINFMRSRVERRRENARKVKLVSWGWSRKEGRTEGSSRFAYLCDCATMFYFGLVYDTQMKTALFSSNNSQKITDESECMKIHTFELRKKE